MNNKLVFVGIVAIVAAFALATTVIPFQSAHAVQQRTTCNSQKALVSANVCGTQVCAQVQAITGKSVANC